MSTARLLASFAILVANGCAQKPIPLGVSANTEEGLYPLLPEFAEKTGSPYPALSDETRALAQRATADLVNDSKDGWLESKGVQAINVVKQRYCYPMGTTGYLQLDRITTATARQRLAGCRAGVPEPLGRRDDTELALVRFACTPRSNGWQYVPRNFEVRAAYSVRGGSIVWVSMDVGDPLRIIPVVERDYKRPNCD